MNPNREYLANKVNPILEPLVTELLTTKPNDPITFMVDWIRQKYNRPKTEACPYEENKEEVESAKSFESSDSSYEDEKVEEPLTKTQVKDLSSKVTRKSISAEAYGIWNKRENFKPKVVPKSEEQKIRIRSKLRTSFIFSAVGPQELEVVLDAMEERRAKEGEVVIRQGDEGDCLYVVESGSLGKEPKPRFLKEYGSGEAFGELALLYNAPRAATITAKTSCVLWSLDRQTFNHIVKDAAIKKRERYEGFLKSVGIFSTVDEYEMTKITDAVKPVEFRAGAQIIKEGDEGNMFYLLEAGEAYATKTPAAGRKPQKVMDYKPGSYFGELALLRNAPRAASVFAKTDCSCLALDGIAFKRVLGPLEEILKRNSEIYTKVTKKAI